MDYVNTLSSAKYPEIPNFSVFNQNTLVFSKHDAIGFINVEDGRVTYHHVIDKSVMGTGVCGISCISGHKYELIYAIGDISTSPRIILFTHPNECIGQLKRRTNSMTISKYKLDLYS